MGTTADRLGRLVAPVAEELDLSLYDVEEAAGTLRVLLDRPGGIDVDTLAVANRRIVAAIDADGTFGEPALEVSSPGLERRLRTPEHLRGAIGERVKVKLRPGVDGDRRLDGVLSAATEDTLTVTADDGAERTVELADVTSARTEFVWGPAPKPGGPNRNKRQKQAGRSAAPATRTTDHTDPGTDETEATR